ncbi:MAG TPA: cell division protein FtsZ, partial [Solirubrobacteraceae bacterium]|nr:cell division protein FtsZ [Solirubrobacteraceae bacterium]
ANIIFGAMVDEKLDDQVWVTVVATGYGLEGVRKSAARFREPAADEVKVQRTDRVSRADRVDRVAGAHVSARRTETGQRRSRLSVDEMDVPEFLPNL